MGPAPVKEVVFVLGGPGSGKGTQCSRIATELGYRHLSTGDLLREEQKKESELSSEIEECIRDGRLVPSATMVLLLKAAILDGDAERFLIDGFPRSKDNLDAWFEAFSDDQVQIKFVLFLHCPKDELRKRLLERGETSGRSDDNLESVLKRFDTFEKESLPVVKLLESMGMVRKVSTVPPKNLVFHRVRRLFRGCQLVDPMQRTLALIKPDAAGQAEEIIQRAEDEGFIVIAKTLGSTWTKSKAEEFYKEHRGKAFFDSLVSFMSSGPLVQLCLEKVDAIRAWRKLAGPTNSLKAKESEPSSLRAIHGTDGTKNAVHGSDSFASALREVNFCFDKAAQEGSTEDGEPGGGGGEQIGSGFAREERTLALLKPGVCELHSDDIFGVLAYLGFQVLKASTQVMKEADVLEFFREHSEEPWFPELRASMTEGGETMALCLGRERAIPSWLSVVGPSDPKEAKERVPRCLRGMYGVDSVNNGFHGSSSPGSAIRELSFWFPEFSQKSPSGRPDGAKPGGAKYDEMMDYLKQKVDPIMSPLLQRVLEARPDDVAGFVTKDLAKVDIQPDPVVAA